LSIGRVLAAGSFIFFANDILIDDFMFVTSVYGIVMFIGNILLNAQSRSLNLSAKNEQLVVYAVGSVVMTYFSPELGFLFSLMLISEYFLNTGRLLFDKEGMNVVVRMDVYRMYFNLGIVFILKILDANLFTYVITLVLNQLSMNVLFWKINRSYRFDGFFVRPVLFLLDRQSLYLLLVKLFELFGLALFASMSLGLLELKMAIAISGLFMYFVHDYSLSILLVLYLAIIGFVLLMADNSFLMRLITFDRTLLFYAVPFGIAVIIFNKKGLIHG